MLVVVSARLWRLVGQQTRLLGRANRARRRHGTRSQACRIDGPQYDPSGPATLELSGPAAQPWGPLE